MKNCREKNKLPHRVQIKIEAVYDTLKSAERKAADYLLAYPQAAAGETLREASEKAGSSMATFVRLAKKLGYQGYQDLKQDCEICGQYESEVGLQSYGYEGIRGEDDCGAVIRKVFQAAIQALDDTRSLAAGSQYAESVARISQAERILVLGAGDAYITAYSASLKFSRIGLNVSCPADYDVQLMEAAKLRKGDVLLLISHSGKTKTLYHVGQITKERSAFVIAITNYPLSPLAKMADEVLLTATFMKNSYNETMAKRIPQMCIVEALYISLLQKKGEQYEVRLEETGRGLHRNKL